MDFSNWLDVFLAEKGVDLEEVMMVEGDSGQNCIPVGCLVDVIKSAPIHEQQEIKSVLVRIDFQNGRVMGYLRHLAQAIAR